MKDKQTTFDMFEDIKKTLNLQEEYFKDELEFEINDTKKNTIQTEENPEQVQLIKEETQENKTSDLEPEHELNQESTTDDLFEISKKDHKDIKLEEKTQEINDEVLKEMANIDLNPVDNETKRINLDIAHEHQVILNQQAGYGKVNILTLGIGGCGCNTISRMSEEGIQNIKLVALDTSKQTLENTHSDYNLLIGDKYFLGHGSGSQYEKLNEVFKEEKEKIQELLKDIDMLFLTGGIGRGTGSVGLVEIGKIAREMGILTIGFATLPKRFESDPLITQKYYEDFVNNVDSYVIVENQRVFDVSRNLPMNKAVKIADQMLVDGIKGISELITASGKINLDYADIKTAFSNKGSIAMGIGKAKGEDAVVDAIEQSINGDIVNFENIRNAKIIIFNIACSKNSVTIDQATRGTDLIYSYNENNKIEHLLFGYSYDENLIDEVRVTFVATGTKGLEINYRENIQDVSSVGRRVVGQRKPREVKNQNTNGSIDLEIPNFFKKK